MKKLSRFFKLIFQFILAIIFVVLVFISIIFGFIFAFFELVFGTGKRLFVAFLTGITKGYRKEEKIKTVMQTTTKSKRTH